MVQVSGECLQNHWSSGLEVCVCGVRRWGGGGGAGAGSVGVKNIRVGQKQQGSKKKIILGPEDETFFQKRNTACVPVQ